MKTTIRGLFFLLVASGSLGPVALPAAATTIETESLGAVDFSRLQTYAWRPGLPAANFEVEKAISEAVDKQLSSRGFRKSDGEADLYVVTWAAKDQFFPAGVLRIEIFVAGMDKPAWRGLAFEVISISDTPKKRQKIAAKAVKQLFKGFVRGN